MDVAKNRKSSVCFENIRGSWGQLWLWGNYYFFFKKRLRRASRKVRPSLSAGSASSGLSSAGEEDRDPPAERGLELIFSLAEEEEKEKEEEEGQRAWWVGREGGVAQWALRGVVEQTLPDCAKAGREYKEEPKKKEKRVKKSFIADKLFIL